MDLWYTCAVCNKVERIQVKDDEVDMKKKAIWAVVSLLLAVFTIWFMIYRSGMSVQDFLRALGNANIGWILLGGLCMFSFIFFEGVSLLQIVRTCGYPQKARRGFLYSAGDTYFSAITPSGTGGQPAIIFFMMQDGIPGAVITATLVINFIAFNVGILFFGIVGFLLAPGIFFRYSVVCRVFIVAGFVIFLTLLILGILMIRKREFIFRIAMKFIGLLHKIRIIKHPERFYRKLEKVMGEYKTCVGVVAGHKGMWFRACLMNVLQRFAQIAVTVFSFRALGGTGSVRELFSTQCFATIGATCIPIPGAIGISDYLMIEGYVNLMEEDFAYQVQMLSRGLSFYCCIIVSGITLMIGLMKIGGKRKNDRSI